MEYHTKTNLVFEYTHIIIITIVYLYYGQPIFLILCRLLIFIFISIMGIVFWLSAIIFFHFELRMVVYISGKMESYLSSTQSRSHIRTGSFV